MLTNLDVSNYRSIFGKDGSKSDKCMKVLAKRSVISRRIDCSASLNDGFSLPIEAWIYRFRGKGSEG